MAGMFVSESKRIMPNCIGLAPTPTRYLLLVILAMRTYAIWGARRTILVFLVFFTLVRISLFANACLNHR